MVTKEPEKETKFSYIKDESDPLKDKYGVFPFIQSATKPEHRFEVKFDQVKDLDESYADKEVKIRARLQRSRVKGKGGFIVLREGVYTVQGCLFVTENVVSKQMITFVSAIHPESIVQIEGKVKKTEKPVESCTQKTVEIDITSIFLVVDATNVLPFQMEDACRKVNPEMEEDDYQEKEEEKKEEEKKEEKKEEEKKEEEKKEEGKDKKKKKEKKEKKPDEKKEKKDIVVKMKTRLDNRVMDLRVPTTQAIFRIQSAVSALFRECLAKQGFIEIHTPKIIPGASEGGANVFKLKYFDREACLAQSPQLYKQMCIIGDMKKVMEVGAVFRAENSLTSRHLCEFTGLDFEMEIKEHYFEVLDVIGQVFNYIFEGINERCKPELEAINNQYPFEPIQFLKEPLKLDFREGVKLLEENGYKQDVNEDLDTENEKTLGRLVKEKYKTDFYILYRYPKSARPFYTMPDPEDENFTNSYDAFVRGEEVLSGAQRIHDYDLLIKKILEKKINPETLKDYTNAFKLGAPPHGGVGIGLERVVKLFTGIKNIKKCVMFPRDPKRVTP